MHSIGKSKSRQEPTLSRSSIFGLDVLSEALFGECWERLQSL
jgi:hypothetical protein